MSQPELKPSPPFGMEVCPACGAYVLQGWPIRRVPAISPEDLAVIKKVRDEMNEELRLLQGYAPNVDEYDATMATLYASWAAPLSALIDKLEAK